MLKRSCFIFLTTLLISLTIFPTCKAEYTKNDKVKVGVMLPLTGPFARFGSSIKKAISALADDQVSFVFDDEGCNPRMAVNAYKRLSTAIGARIFLGPWCGSPQMAVAPLLQSAQQIAVLGSSAPEAVFSASNQRMFSTQHSIEADGRFIAEKLNERGLSSVVNIFYDNAFSRAHEAAFRASYKGKILATYAYTSEDLSELKRIALKVKQLKPEALYVPDASPLMAGLTKELKLIGAQSKIFSVYSAQSDDVLRALGQDGEGLIYSYPDIGSEDAIQHFPTLAAKILIKAIKACGENIDCIRTTITTQNAFDASGVLPGKLILKTIRDGKFVAE